MCPSRAHIQLVKHKIGGSIKRAERHFPQSVGSAYVFFNKQDIDVCLIDFGNRGNLTENW